MLWITRHSSSSISCRSDWLGTHSPAGGRGSGGGREGPRGVPVPREEVGEVLGAGDRRCGRGRRNGTSLRPQGQRSRSSASIRWATVVNGAVVGRHANVHRQGLIPRLLITTGWHDPGPRVTVTGPAVLPYERHGGGPGSWPLYQARPALTTHSVAAVWRRLIFMVEILDCLCCTMQIGSEWLRWLTETRLGAWAFDQQQASGIMASKAAAFGD
jgi:hypothetical protein